jgi:hypothetical protein
MGKGMPTPREIMEAEHRRALEKAQEIERDMQELERIVAKYGLLVVPTPSDSPPVIEKVNRATYVRAANESEAIIRATGHPWVISDLFRTLTIERGAELEGKQPLALLASALSTHKNLKFIKDVGWWIKGIPWPPTADDIAKLQADPVYRPERHKKTWEEVPPAKGGPRRSPQKQVLLDAVKSILKGRKEAMKFPELFERVKESGVAIGGTNERQNFAVFLSKYSCFMTEGRRGGWRYIPERDFERDDLTPVASLTEEQARREYLRLSSEIAAHDKRYYEDDAPAISDAAYDALKNRLRAIIERFPDQAALQTTINPGRR